MLPFVISIIIMVIRVYEFIILARAVLSWFQSSPSRFLKDAFRVTYVLTEPVVAPVRVLMRRLFPNAQALLMFSTVIAMLVLEVVCWVLQLIFF